jgi:plasmid maintenance system antidote protein VapI
MAEYVAKRDRKRCPTHPGELLREDVIPATGKTRSEIAALCRQITMRPTNLVSKWPNDMDFQSMTA